MELKATDLRVGNILNYDTPECDMVNIEVRWGHIKWISEDPKGFNLVHSPIPLTEEWLEKFGFVDNNYTMDFKKISFSWSSRIVATGVRSGWYCKKHPHIKFVHQLQNIIHALSGQEL